MAPGPQRVKKVTSCFADFEDFPLENRSKNSVFVKENLFRRLPNHKKNSPAAGCQLIIILLFYGISIPTKT